MEISAYYFCEFILLMNFENRIKENLLCVELLVLQVTQKQKRY